MKPINKEVFRAYDIRGIVDRDFDLDWVETLGRACGTWFHSHGWTKAVVGHDCRHSSPGYQERLAKGLASCGLDVLLLDLVPTPAFYFAAKTLGYQAGVMVTASHNPPEFNGFKVWAGETTAHTEQVQAIYETMASGVFVQGSGTIIRRDIVPTYLDALASQARVQRPVKVVVDGGNGTGGLITAELLCRVGCEVIELYCEPDGNFPNHHPDPVVEKYMHALQAKVLETGAACGIGLDGDDDRIGVVDEKGRLMFGDQLLAIYARHMLRDYPDSTVIGEVKCSHLMYREIEDLGGVPLMWKTGHSLIKAKMKETGARLAGEMSGHMFFADRYHGYDDATYAALRLVEILSEGGAPLSERLAHWPRTYNTPEIRVDCPEEIKFAIVAKAQEHFRRTREIIDVDGARILFPDGWGLVRASNTQPVLVLRFEAESAERLAALRQEVEDQIQAWIQEALESVKPVTSEA
ncbi:phosphomannomutase/phosphoglucomutase [Desulfocurvibacter africanus]|uniref:phosphomannomutase/phosphoglucomutase n=1 Tax=Desulfocurvibacter africanus TaxID=873 RepID=UPI002FDA4493